MIERVLFVMIGFCLGIIYSSYNQIRKRKIAARRNYRVGRFDRSYSKMHESGRSILPYFDRLGIKTVIAYGGGYNYGVFMREMENSGIDIVLADRNRNSQKGIIAPEDVRNTPADIIVITSSYYFESIFHKLKKMGETRPIISFQELVYNAEMESE